MYICFTLYFYAAKENSIISAFLLALQTFVWQKTMEKMNISATLTRLLKHMIWIEI